MTGRRINRTRWPRGGPHRRLLEYLDTVHWDNGVKSLRTIGERMPIAHSRVSEILRGDALPADDDQAGKLARAMGGGDDDATRAVRLCRQARAALARQTPRGHEPRIGGQQPGVMPDAMVDEWIATALTGHWLPSVHGSDVAVALGHRFTGRLPVIHHLVGWLSTATDHRLRVVTGDPGSGKSAVLAWIVLNSNPRWSGQFAAEEESYPLLPSGSVLAAVHARGRTLSEIVAIIAWQCGVPAADADELVRNLAGDTVGPVLVVIDAVDESPDVDAVLIRLIRPLARTASSTQVRLLVGARRHIARRIGARWVELLDLDDEYADPAALARYVRHILVDVHDVTPYRGLPERAARVAAAVATRAGGSFLVARLVAMALTMQPEPANIRDEFPDSVHAAMESYLDAVPADRRTLDDLLRPLAYAQGFGLPQPLWAELAGALCGLPGKYGLRDIDALFDGPVASLLTVTAQHDEYGAGAGSRLYRLFHDALDDCVAAVPSPNPDAPQDPAGCRHVIARALVAAARPGDGQPDWQHVDPYLRRHLATHAAGTPIFDALVQDPRFLLAADRERLLSALSAGVATEQAATARAAYELVSHHLGRVNRLEQAAYLALSALQEGSTTFAEQLKREAEGSPWWPVAARWDNRALHRTLYHHDGMVNAVAVTALGDEPMVVSGGEDETVRICSLIDTGNNEAVVADLGTPVLSLETLVLDGLPVVVAGAQDGHLYLLDVPTLHRLGRSSDRHGGAVSAVQTVVFEGQPILVSGNMDGELARWSVLPCARLGEPMIVGPGEVSALACFDDGEGARLVSCSAPSGVQVWDGWLRPERTVHSGRPTATVVAVFDQGTRPTLVTGHNDGSLRLLDPGSGQVSGELVAVQSSYISAVTISGRAVICAGEQGVLTVLDPAADLLAPIDLPGHHDGVAALASVVVGDRPVAVSGGEDGTVRLWDLAAASLAATADARASWAASRVVPVGDRLAAVLSNEREIRFVDAVDRTLFGPPIPVDPSTPVTALATVNRAGDLLVATGDSGGEIIVRFVSGTGDQLRFTGHRGWVADAAFTVLDNAPVLVTAGHDGMLRCSNLTDGSLARPSIELPEIRGTVAALAVTTVDSIPIAAVSTTGRQVQAWDLSRGELVASIGLAEADGAVGVWAAAGATFVGGTTTGRTIVCRLGTTDVLRSVRREHADVVTALACGELLGVPVIVSGSENGVVSVRAADADPAVSFALDARVEDLLPGPGGRISVATNRGVAVIEVRSSAKGFA